MHNLLSYNIVIETSLSLCAELDLAFFESKKGKIFADADILAWKNISTALAEYDLPDAYILAMIDLHTQIFWV